MQKFVNVRTTAESVKPLEIDDYHVYVNTGIKEIHEEAKDGDLALVLMDLRSKHRRSMRKMSTSSSWQRKTVP